MKLTTYSAIITLIAIPALLGNAYWRNNAHNASLQLDECARQNNVYQCKIEFVPTEAPKVVYKTADLLPPPELN